MNLLLENLVVVTCPDFEFDHDLNTAQVLEEVIKAPIEDDPANEMTVGVSNGPHVVVDLHPNVVETIVEEPKDGGSSIESMDVQAKTRLSGCGWGVLNF